MEAIRSFIAIELPEEVKAGLEHLLEGLRPYSFVQWVEPRGIHLTLKFLGNVPVSRLSQIEEVVARTAARAAPFQLEMFGLGAFPDLGRPRVAWVGVEGEVERLLDLQKGLEQGLIPLGFAPEGRAFSPHLTLGRVREGATPAERQRLGVALARTKMEKGFPIPVQALNLMRSQLTPRGALYSRLASAPLGSDLPKARR